MKLKKWHIAMILLILISIIGSLYYYESLPDSIPFHWGVSGEVDGYTSKEIGVIFVPIIEVFLVLLFIVIPLIEPKKENVKKFIGFYNAFAVIIIGIFAYLHWLMLLVGNGATINFVQYFIPAFGVLFFYIGIMLKHAEQNYTIGIRTPWTLASKKVWKKTHLLGGKLFQITGIICFATIFAPQFAIWFVLIPIIITVIIVFAYSYYLYSKETKKK